MLHLGNLRIDQNANQSIDWPLRFAALAACSKNPYLKAFYAQGTPAGDDLLKDVPMVALDVETTGLNLSRDEIVSIGVVPMTLNRIQASASRYWVVRPSIEMTAESITIHAITHSQIETAPDLSVIIGELLQTLAGRIVVVHCRDIERGFLNTAFKTRLGEGFEFPVIDTMELEARLHRKPPSFIAKLLRRPTRGTSIRMAPSRARYRLPRYRAHHALTDALAAAELLQAQVAHRFSPQTPLRNLWK
jgi:DNA polymerase-3 subunit epsilon